MSSINASERSRSNDESRKAREEYSDKETELIKKHKKQLADLGETYDKKLSEVESSFSEKIDDIRGKNKETLSEKDIAQQKQIDKIKNLYVEQLKRRAEETENFKNSVLAAHRDQLTKERDINEQQKDALKMNFKSSLADRDREYQTFAENARETVKESIQTRTKRLNEKHENELKLGEAERSRETAQARHDLEETISSYKTRLKNQDTGYRSQIKRQENSWMDGYKRQEVDNDQALVLKNETQQLERKVMAKSFNDALKKKSDALANSFESLKSNVSARIDGDLDQAEREIQQLRKTQNIDQVKNKKLRDLDKRNVVNQYEERIKLLEGEKEGIFDIVNERSRVKIGEASKKTDRVMQNAYKDHRFQMDLAKSRSAEYQEQSKLEHVNELDHVNTRADLHLKKLTNETEKNQKQLTDLYTDNVDSIKETYAERLENQRNAQFETLSQTRLSMNQKLRQVQDDFARKLEDSSKLHNQQVSEMKDQQRKELQKLESSYGARIDQKAKEFKTEKESESMKFEMKYAKQEEAHQREIERMQQKHQEQMAQLASRIDIRKKS